MKTQAQANEIERLKQEILDQGVIPKRAQFVDNLIEEATMQGYERGFKEAEALYKFELRQERLRGALDELNGVQLNYGHYMATTFIEGKPQRVGERITQLYAQLDTESSTDNKERK